MKFILFLFFTLLIVSTSVYAFQRTEINFDNGWKFYKSDAANAHTVSFDDSHWESITLPHTWNNFDGQDGGGDYYRGPAWYRKYFVIPKKYQGKKIFLRFGAANMIARVYVNGNFIGEHKGGYAAFAFDITSGAQFGKSNAIAVRVDNTAPAISSEFHLAPLSADFTMFGGIHRSVQLIITDNVHISPLDYASPGMYIQQTNVSDAAADIRITTKVVNDDKSTKHISVETTIADGNGSEMKKLNSAISLNKGQSLDVVQNTVIQQPHLWNGRNDPYLYSVTVSLKERGKILDQVTQPLGVRYFSIDATKGFFLNGKPYDLHGFNRHEDKKDKGRAVSDTDREEDMEAILDIGSTIVRLAHYQHAEKMYELCDENGVVAWAEIPLVDFISEEKIFGENIKQQLIELIRQNYNHPSIFFWSLFNEIYLRKGPEPLPLLKELNLLAHIEDSTRPTVGALNFETEAAWTPDLIAFNKYFGWYEGEIPDFGPWLDDIHRRHPHNAIGVSEYGAGGSIFHHTEEIEKTVHNAMWHPEEYQTLMHEEVWKMLNARPYLWVKTLWVGFDFSADIRSEGFSAGVNDKGLITHDHATKKDAYYWYKANWNDAPMVFITQKHFAMRDTNRIAVKIYSNAKEVELFVNETSLGKEKSNDHIFKWKNVSLNSHHSNKIKAVAVVNGKEITDQCWLYCK